MRLVLRWQSMSLHLLLHVTCRFYDKRSHKNTCTFYHKKYIEIFENIMKIGIFNSVPL